MEEDYDYELKFELMQKYIPFLDSMISRLESNRPPSSSKSSNPRQAQLDKIRSLRDLLSNRSKRMKMENLYKCQQVLVNLYAKVELKDSFSFFRLTPDPGFSIDPPTPQEKSDLEAVRNKLKTVAKRQEDDQDTLPEILRVDDVEEMCTAGSKEPALFQRRPNKSSVSPTVRSPAKLKEKTSSPQSSSTKRNYTRVLVSPDSSARRWSASEPSDEKLFSRRSPRRSPRRYSPSYHKKERKKSSKDSPSRKSKDLNITLKVPEDSLSTLNTKDIFARIINCKDGDVDIDSLRELRKQILTELKKTGATDDISDLILQSYNKKEKKTQNEVEEGELSDSESEIIENVYGSLSGNLICNDQNEAKTSTDKDKARKIQICLVLNSDKKLDPNTNTSAELLNTCDVLELEMYDKESKEVKTTDNIEKIESSALMMGDDDSVTKAPVSSRDNESSNKSATDVNKQKPAEEKTDIKTPKEPVKYIANFYKPLTEGLQPVDANKIEDIKEGKQIQADTKKGTDVQTGLTVSESPKTSNEVCSIHAELERMEGPAEILVNKTSIPNTPTNSTLSEIDILQALKNEILSESITIPGSETSTPLLHQPKINKVASAKEILPKKRISIENYKKKTDRDKAVSSIRYYFDDSDSKDDLIKKPSLKLTEKECERFNIQKKMSFNDDSSDADDGSEIQGSDLYSDLVPKSPDRDEASNSESTPPVIIPGDPVKSVPIKRNLDVDMRTLPIISPNQNKTPTLFSNVAGLSNKDTISAKTDTKSDQIRGQNKPVQLDPRFNRNSHSSQSPSPHSVNTDRTSRSAFPNTMKSPVSSPVITPNARSYDVPPNRKSLDSDQSTKKPVYASSFTKVDSKERENLVAKDSKIVPSGERKSRFEDVGDTSSWSSSDVSINTRYTDSFTGENYSKGQRNDRYSLDNRDSFSYKRSECPRTPLPSFGRSDVPVTSSQTFNKLEKPMTPSHSFGRAECPPTPSHYFGRSECPPTPSHSFGRLECPPTPSHTFGRSDCPPTPIHPFGSLTFNITESPLTPNNQFGPTECPPTPYYGRNECPPTPNHGFGRSDCPPTPNHPFGRSEFNAQKCIKDPRLNRKPAYESNSQQNDRDRGYYKESGYYRGSSYKSHKPYTGSDYTSQDKEKGRNSKYRYYAPGHAGRQVNKDPLGREQAVGGSIPNDDENDRLFSRERGQNNSAYVEVASKRGNQREMSAGRHMRAEDNVQSSSKGPRSKSSIERDNRSPKCLVGNSFKIDTSVNATFQKFLETGQGIQIFEYNTDTRRKRAASVGRALVKESLCEQVSESSKRNTEYQNKKEVFRRASSMGRDYANSNTDERSFQEIKADFKTYKHPKESSKFDTGKIRNIDKKSNIARDGRVKEYYEKYKDEKRGRSTSKQMYSPRKNNRDTRMSKENNVRDKYEYPRGRKSGIIYSNDNIVKGAILTSGYGVKNYKIPKIKRVVEEKVEETPKNEEIVNKKDAKENDKRKNTEKIKSVDENVQEKANDKSKVKNKVPTKLNKDAPKEKLNESPKRKNKETPKGKIKEIIKEGDTRSDSESEKRQIQINDMSESDEPMERRSTRLSKKLAAKTKKAKKSIISDSDSDTDISVTEKLPKVDQTDLEMILTSTPPQESSPVKNKIESKQPNAIDIHTNFGLELEMFSDNVVSDPVLDNINALIADLDNDLDASKNESSNNFMNEITLENMMQNITSPQDNSSESRDEFANVLKAVDELSKTTDLPKNNSSEKNQVDEVNSNIAHVSAAILQKLEETEDSSLKKSTASENFDNLLASKGVSIQSDVVENKKNKTVNPNNLPLNKPTNEEIVSTTETEKETTSVEKSNLDERSMDGCSTPDSTINTDVLEKTKSDECVADSTNEEVQNETNVTSTDSVECKPNSSSTDTKYDSELGNLLTMLQDKSKIKKLLSMLGDQSGENDKIKKKLEKLSEIVSDDESEEKKKQPEKNETEISVLTDDIKPDVNQTVYEKPIVEETEAQLHEDRETKLTTDEENKLNKNDDEAPLNNISEDQKNDEDQDLDESFEFSIGEDAAETVEANLQVTKGKTKKKTAGKKSKFARKGKGRWAKKVTSLAEKRVTRATAAVDTVKKTKKPTRELQKLHDDIKEMFIRDDILSASGIRMCRLAKMVDEKKDEVIKPESEPVVVLEKFKDSPDKSRDNPIPVKVRKKPGRKPKPKVATGSVLETEKAKYKPGPKSKTKNKKESDPYAFETESVGDAVIEKASDDDLDSSSDSEICSLASSKSESSEVLAEIKKKTKRKRGRGWQDGVIKPKSKKKKLETKLESTLQSPDCNLLTEKDIAVLQTEKQIAILPIEKQIAVLPTENQIAVVSAEKKIADLPSENENDGLPTEKQIAVLPTENENDVLPSENELDVMPTENQIDLLPTEKHSDVVPDPEKSFTDKNYCFRKNESIYSCRHCEYNGADIVHHYVNEHPHVEIPLSRMAPPMAKEAIGLCKEINLRAISKIASDKYVCVFCFQEFVYSSSVLETFFWHIVSMHTGEYKHTCSECSNENRCPFSSDIPPPPKETKGQLIGYICKKCNFTQLSLENLKKHVIRRHNDEQTAVYTINLSAMSRKTVKEFLRNRLSDLPGIQARSPRVITSRASVESSESEAALHKPTKQAQLASIQSKITFEHDDNASDLLDLTLEEQPMIKLERIESENADEMLLGEPQSTDAGEITQPAEVDHQPVLPPQEVQQSSLYSKAEDPASQPSNDIVDYPHFKINITESGAKEYICCINGQDYHFKTTLLISMKKHVQLKHSENWDGYCFICKVIVTPQGAHKFKDCFQHYLDKHMDNFPVYQKKVVSETASEEVVDKQARQTDSPAPSKPYINVRPICELISTAADSPPKETASFPIIQSVVSLGAESPRLNPTYPTVSPDIKIYKYEEVQAKVMLNKHRVVLETMMARDKLVKVFKCAGRFCSFTSDFAEDSVLHASTHQRIGGTDALKCSYCDFDANENAIDIVKHVFEAHGHCQYSCGQCFYRAAASQLVGAHAARVHGVAQPGAVVLRTNVATSISDDGADMLDRELAAPHYVCHHAEIGGSCKFRTYAPVKFYEHLQQKHAGATSHPCYICQENLSSSSELVQHMKVHDLNVYQCTWCVHGADNEGDIVAHVSEVHPMKQPQAYLRMFRNKEGSNEVRVLPRVFLNKMKVETINVTPSTTKENAVREAERSIDLEKLIGLTMMMEPQLDVNEEVPFLVEQPLPDAEEQTVAIVAPDTPVVPVAPTVSLAELPETIHFPVSKAVGSMTVSLQSDLTNQSPVHTPVVSAEPSVTITRVPIKSEVTETTENLPTEVVVIDSDDEDTRQPVIDLSEEDNSASSTNAPVHPFHKRVPTEILSTCPKCQQICKSINGLKKHFFYCYPDKEEGCKCAHCPYMASSRDNIMHHYMHDHCDRNVYQCGICRVTQVNMNMVKRHLKYIHKEKDFVVSFTVQDGVSNFVVNPAKKEKREMPKRKLSAGPTETLNKRRFWPQEVSQLPINPIFDHLVYCEICEFSTKVRLNMCRHLQLHAEQQPVAQTAPVNPVPHLETNEKHFDKMVNLASSSLQPRAPERAAPTYVPVPREHAARYPRLVAARQRNTCGAPACSYTSVDEPTLRRHWEALHSGLAGADFRCVHCPDNQTTDTSRPITAARVLQHLKMHDECLYACSKCHVYHYRREYMEKHVMELHPTAPLYIVRESESAAAAAAAASSAASSSATPTMDLKPWQCGFCEFKSMLRPEVVEHCFKIHQSKMQFRCGYCPYRASVLENVNNHLAHSHVNEPENVIYYYYREGSLPDAEDGTPRWMKQRQKMASNLPEVKEEQETPEPTPSVPLPPDNINLNLVKKEVEDAATVSESLQSVEELCRTFGQFCEPNGIKFKCPLCNVISEDTREAMQSHLYEELQYRKWGCGLCNYKAFHKAGLTEHMSIEHFRQYEHIELPKDINKEKWVSAQLDHQAAIIDRHKANLAKQKIAVERVSKPVPVAAPSTVEVADKFTRAQLEEAFGEFGAPRAVMYCCPKCSALQNDEAAMRDHLEMELNKIRWGCTNCSDKYQTYHEAQFHCKGHDGPSRPKEAIRDPSMRAAWVTNIIQAQKKMLQGFTATHNPEPLPEKFSTENDNNSLLVVRYEERVPTPDLVPISRKRSAPESDDERLVIDEGGPKRKTVRSCPYCTYQCKYYNSWKEHVLKHHNLKPYSCCYCNYSCSYRQGIISHTEKSHPNKPLLMKMTAIPPEESYVLSPKKKIVITPEEDTNVPKVICLFCENSIPETNVDLHLHENIRPDFAKKGDVVVKCCICLVLRLDVKSLQDHHNLAHPHVPVNYALFKLHHDTRETHFCGHCDDIGFKFLRDLKTHHNAVHPTLLFKYTTVPYAYLDLAKESRRKEEIYLQKRCARKSTTKLPGGKTVAKKSTTKLPYSVTSTSDDGYSYYRTKPEPIEKYANVTTLMSFCNRMMPFTLKKLSQIINIEPVVIVKDIRAGPSSDMTH